MYISKYYKSICSILLICGLLVVFIPTRAYAVGPVVLGPALKYAIGAGIVAGGLYAADSDSLNYVINDYWSKASDHVKQQWQSAVVYGTGIGILLLNDPLRNSINDYLESNYSPGPNEVDLKGIVELVAGSQYDYAYINGLPVEWGVPYEGSDGRIYLDVSLGGFYHETRNMGTRLFSAVEVIDISVMYGWNNNPESFPLAVVITYNWQGQENLVFAFKIFTMGELLDWFGDQIIIQAENITMELEMVGDSLGFGNATEGEPDIKVPCPPVPAAEWPDQWLDDLQDEMNRTGNPTLDDETSIEEWEDEYEWYLDPFGNIYKVKKGQPPRDPGDEKKMVPGPPLPAPDVPENHPTEDDPDLTIEHHPPQTTRTENPDGSTTETTTQTTTTTRKWWDPSSQRWRTTTSDTTTTTTVDFAPDGTETGRTTTTTTQPKGEREETAQPDDTAIDWEPLRKGLGAITHKFPFSLPWDFYNSFKQFEGNEWDGVVEIRINTVLADFNFDIDLSMFDGIRNIVKKIELLIFDVGLIFATRRLMGGGV